MIYSQDGLRNTEYFESCRLMAYRDIKGVWTCGYGHTGPDVGYGVTCTVAQAEKWLQDDILSAASVVNSLVRVALTQGEFDALTDFVFNVGSGNFFSSTLLRVLNRGDYAGAANEFDKWDHASGKVVQGLLRRREQETAEFIA